MNNINSFQAEFKQSITDDKAKVLEYTGTIKAVKPQNALWKYKTPVEKNVYIGKGSITIVEPEIEQVIIRKIDGNFDFFKMVEGAKKVEKNLYATIYKDTLFTIKIQKGLVKSISYKDEFENSVEILFTNQIQNSDINSSLFFPSYPLEYDVIRD